MDDKQKNTIINITVPILAIFITLIVYFLLFVSLKNYSNSSISYEEKASLDRYRLDFKLEDKIISYIESKKSLNLEEMLESNFYELEVYSSYHMLENVNSDYHMLENTKSRLDLKNLLYRIKDNRILKKVLLNKKYDILSDRSYREFSKKDSILHFKKVINKDDIQYELAYE
ncbi:hypothetical protein [Clostridioides sp. ZZV15-6597]|uniref:hypothetical protein n=1 Tax=Clostridioides sp. ZZV15-6597 TaxID=2811500 RepID=UPI001D11F710|nr:hypothetical protein [Clostridioides sp. ZZV15-6597]